MSEDRHAAQAHHNTAGADEDRIRLIADRASDMISCHSPEGVFTYVSAACMTLLGFTADELTGKDALALVHPDDRYGVMRALRPLGEGEDIATVTCRLRRKDGAYVWTESTDRAVREAASGRIIELQSVTRDVSDRKRADDALRESEARFRTIFERSPMGMAIADGDGRFLRVNRAYERLVGYPAERLLHMCWADLTHPDDVGPNEQAARELLSGRAKEWRQEKRYINADGETVWAQMHVVPLHDGPATHTLAIAEDITERKRAEQQVRTLSELKSDFVALVSHELRAPLTNIQGGLELVAADAPELPEHVTKTVGVLSLEAQRLHRLVESILDVSRLDAGKLPIRSQTVSAVALLERVCQASARDGEARPVELAAPADLPRLLADEVYLEQVVSNLIANAVRFSPPGKPVEVKAAAEHGGVAITVTDRGPGIALPEQRRIFQPFYRSRRADTQYKGHGLGLYFARKLIEAMGGMIDVQSPVFGDSSAPGTRFVVRLPQAKEGA